MEVYHGFSAGLFWGLEKCRLWIYWIAWNSTPWTKFWLTWFEKQTFCRITAHCTKTMGRFTVCWIPMKCFLGYPGNPPIPASSFAFAAGIPHNCTPPARHSARHGQAGARSNPGCSLSSVEAMERKPCVHISSWA